MKDKTHLAIIGGGPSALFMFKQLVDAKRKDFIVDIFEKKQQLGAGMPYSADGSNDEHITNVSGNEIPELVTTVSEWLETAPKELLQHFNLTAQSYNEYKVLPRLVFGQYLKAQFELLCAKSREQEIGYGIHFNSTVTDIIDHPDKDKVTLQVNGENLLEYNKVIICTGHSWPLKIEGKIKGYFDSPYPPAKLQIKTNEPVAIKGSSLTAFDALRTLSRANGQFTTDADGMMHFKLNDDSKGFKLIMHSREGLLPAIRFHLEDPHLSKTEILTKAEMLCHRKENGGFTSLDYLFDKNFKEIFKDKEPKFYETIKDMNLETFVGAMMAFREHAEPFALFEAEYKEAQLSIKQEKSVYWKEVLAILSFSMNYPAKYLSAEDYLRLKKVLMPLISIVIAFVPQSSCKEVMALHQAGVLDIIAVGEDSRVEPGKSTGATYFYKDNDGLDKEVYFKTFVDCVGQAHMAYEELPYQSMITKNAVIPARLRFRDGRKAKELHQSSNDNIETHDGKLHLRVPGIAINDSFQPVDEYGAFNPRIYVMAVPYIGGFNPDYSGLDFCEAASMAIIKSLNQT